MNDINEGGLSAASSWQITVAAAVLIFSVFSVVLFLYLRRKVYSGAVGSSRSRRLAFAPHEPTLLPRRALDPSILNSLPVTIFGRLKDFEEGSCLDCAVCLCELDDGEEVRLLPKCRHGFHVECIDMWFRSNDTCPLCRGLINGGDTVTTSTETTSVENSSESLISEGSSSCAGSSSSSYSRRRSKEGMLVIDIPTRTVEAFSSSNINNSTPLRSSSKVPSKSPLPTGRLLEEIKSPVFSRMESFKRMLSGGKASFNGASSSYSCSVGCDIEQGGLADSHFLSVND